MELLNHLKHPHPMVLSEEKESDNFPCMICWDCVSGLCYCCNECTFVVHKWCAELPLELTNHQLHPDHPLVILSNEERGEKDTVCDKCKLDMDNSYAFCCTECSLFLHPECALLPQQVELEFHDEDSLPSRKSLTFKKRPGGWSPCKVCNQGLIKSWFAKLEDDSKSFHIHCAMLPKTVKHEKHIHDLTLHVPIEKEKQYVGCYCDLCEEERDLDQWLYYCARCEVKGHLSCGFLGSPPPNRGILTSSPLYIVENETPSLSDDSEYMSALELRVKRTEENVKPLGELVHFSHEHPLFLFDDVWDGIYSCSACNMWVHGKVYSCAECHWFFLHKWCAELPQEVHFGLHFEHPLTLLSTSKLACSYCRTGGNAFSYGCLECGFGIHPTCAFLSEFGLHTSHDHPLEVIIFTSDEHCWGFMGKFPVKSRQTPPCNACLFPCEGMSLGCNPCGFYLHVNCSLYPITRKAETHMHNLNLNYDYHEDPKYTDFYCDACEKPRTPKCWVYSCPDPKCYIVAHLDCGEPILFPTSDSDKMIEHQEDCNECRCTTCDKERDPNDWVYYCPSPSLHLLHGLECPKVDKPIQRILKSDPVYAFLKENVTGNMRKVEELQHFSHEHLLVLCDEKWNCEIHCEACSRGIYGKTYICHECGYYLHKWCAQIPREMHFRCHSEHPLTLLPGHDSECSVCKASNFGFSFSCEKCDFEAHILCLLMPDRNLETHKHPTDIMVYMPENSTPVSTGIFPLQIGQVPMCNACLFPCEGLTMVCKLCEFHLHVGCVWYLLTIKTETHMHSLTLDYKAHLFPPEIIAISHRKLCDVCDKALTEDGWGYLCLDEKCNTTAAHLDCAVPNLFVTSSFEPILVHLEK